MLLQFLSIACIIFQIHTYKCNENICKIFKKSLLVDLN